MSSTSDLSSFAARLRRLIQAAPPSLSDPLFDDLARALFALQFRHNLPYRRFCQARRVHPETVAHWTQIPAAPTSAFKELELSCLSPEQRTAVFHSSGTTGQPPSRHFHNASSLALYEASLSQWFDAHFQLPPLNSRPTPVPLLKSAIGNWQLAILTPPPSQAPHSSLVHMFETIRRQRGFPESAFVGTASQPDGWTLQLQPALDILQRSCASQQPLLILGTAFSYVHLLDHLADRRLCFHLPPDSCVLETGGYKGRSRSLPKPALHSLITRRLGIPSTHIVCEYGMSELSSQAYDSGIAPPMNSVGTRSTASAISRMNGDAVEREPPVPGNLSHNPQTAPRLFRFPPWARVQIISPEHGGEVSPDETGLIRIFDLANVYSVMAVQTEDLGIRRRDGFALLGRAALAEPRGCSLMVA